MRSAFKLVLIILSLIPLYFGLAGIFGGTSPQDGGLPVTADLDNQFRYLSAYYLSAFFLILWVLGDIDRRGMVLKIVILAIFIGGLARLNSYLTVGEPGSTAMVGMALELGAPLIAFWQHKISHSVGPVVP